MNINMPICYECPINSILKISRWTGRFGNNVTQLTNIIYLGMKIKALVIYPKHDIIKSNEFDFRDLTLPNSDIEISKEFFNLYKDYPKLLPIPADDIIRIRNNLIKPLLNINFYDEPLDTDTLVIHIRAGDIFSPNPHSGYLQPPLSFYHKVIEHCNPKKIILVYEDNKNPCIDQLLKIYRNIIISHSKTLEEDIALILSARKFCIGNGSFGNILASMNPNLEMLYSCSLNNISFKRDKQIQFGCRNYIKNGEWKNSPKQINLMINHKITDIISNF